MPRQPAYFDSQASAAAALKIDIYDLREAKAEGCPAFRSGRVYRKPLLAWFNEKRRRMPDLANSQAVPDSANHSSSYLPGQDAELSRAHWDRKKARLDYERALFRFEVEKQKYLPISDLTVALGQLLVAFRTALNMLPGSAARWVVGLRDFHEIKDKLQSEVDAILQALYRCDYLCEEPAKAIAQSLPFDSEIQALVAKLNFADKDPAVVYELIARVAVRVVEEFGRSCLSDVLQRKNGA